MIIKNFKTLATTPTRKHALKIINTGIEAVLPKNAMRKQIKVHKNTLNIQQHSWNLSKYRRLFVIGAGKASSEMARVLEEILGKRITKGIVIDTQKKALKKIKVVQGTHPLLSQTNVKATNEIIQLIKQATREDLIICLISGGGSALLESPRIPLPHDIHLTKHLLKSGATIKEINTIRKHLSYVKGGQLTLLAFPATLITLIISDVMTNDLQVIASGPTVKDTTTLQDAKRIQKKYHLPNLPFIETPKESFKHATNILLVTNGISAKAMKKKAQELGYQSKIISIELEGEARVIGKKLAQSIKAKTALIATGETTVTVKGRGKGGRNQELALAAVPYLEQGTLISCSSDGVDFITDAAGAIVDGHTKEQARQQKINIQHHLNNNDSYNALKNLNSLIITGKTGTNVADLMLALGEKRSKIVKRSP